MFRHREVAALWEETAEHGRQIEASK